jgi:hypothetical protein
MKSRTLLLSVLALFAALAILPSGAAKDIPVPPHVFAISAGDIPVPPHFSARDIPVPPHISTMDIPVPPHV